MEETHSKPTTFWIRVTMFAVAGMVAGIALAVPSLPEDGATKAAFRVFVYAVFVGGAGAFLAAYTSPHGFSERYKKQFRKDMARGGLLFALVGFPVLMADGAVAMLIAMAAGSVVVDLCERAKRRRMSRRGAPPER